MDGSAQMCPEDRVMDHCHAVWIIDLESSLGFGLQVVIHMREGVSWQMENTLPVLRKIKT